jgi:hypothetical protein
MSFHQYQELMTPDGDSAVVLLCGGDWVMVWLTNAHLPLEQRYRSYRKDDPRWKL